jgi:hypothetical protein
MPVIEAGSKGGSHGHASAPHGIGDFGTSVLHRPRCYRPETSPLNLERRETRAVTEVNRYRCSELLWI